MQSLESQVRGLQDDLFAAQEELQVTMEKHEQVRNLIVTQGLQSLLETEYCEKFRPQH